MLTPEYPIIFLYTPIILLYRNLATSFIEIVVISVVSNIQCSHPYQTINHEEKILHMPEECAELLITIELYSVADSTCE
jgi:hypothetical protein